MGTLVLIGIAVLVLACVMIWCAYNIGYLHGCADATKLVNRMMQPEGSNERPD